MQIWDGIEFRNFPVHIKTFRKILKYILLHVDHNTTEFERVVFFNLTQEDYYWHYFANHMPFYLLLIQCMDFINLTSG